jgi:hypothetical protein
VERGRFVAIRAHGECPKDQLAASVDFPGRLPFQAFSLDWIELREPENWEMKS